MGSETHSRLGASSAARWLACPGSFRLCETAPPSRPSKYSEEGTLAHHCAEQVLLGNVEPWELDAPAEMMRHVAGYVDFVHAQARGRKIHTERLLSLKSIDADAYGTVDVAIQHPGNKVVVIDLKYGAGYAVEAQDNPQLAFYGLAASEYFGCKANEITCHIYQPRAHHADGPIRTWVLDPPAIKQWHQRLKAGAMAAREPSAPLNPNPACRWCPALAVCPAQTKVVSKQAVIDFTAAAPLPTPKALDADTLAAVLSRALDIESWLKAVREWAVNEMLAKRPVAGWKLVAGRGSRSWVDEKMAAQFLTAALGERAWERKLLSVAQAEKLLDTVPDEWVKRSTGGPTLANAQDKRNEFTASNEDFTPWQEK